MKSVVIIVALATQCVSAKLRNGYGYLDGTFHVLEWIAYLKRLSLIALMLCSVVLYYVPKSRTYARRACCALIDFVASGLKFALTAADDKCEHENMLTREQDSQIKETRIQELYRKVGESDTSMRKQEGKKPRTKRSIEGRYEYRRRHDHRHHHHRNADIKDASLRSRALIKSSLNKIDRKVSSIYSDSPRRMTVIDEIREKDSLTIPQDIHWKTIVTKCNASAEKLKDNINLRQQQDHKDYVIKNNKHEEIVNATQCQLKNVSARLIMDEQISSSCYGENLANRELRHRRRRENRQFRDGMEKKIDDCYENTPFITNRVKPVLLRVVNWFFGGCPEASKRHREWIEEVGKEEISQSTNTWLL